MARTSLEVQADIDRVTKEIASSSRSMNFGDRGMSKRSTDEALKALNVLKAELSSAVASESTSKRVRQIRLYGGSGF